jgi:acyl-homoserine-lactone acylase
MNRGTYNQLVRLGPGRHLWAENVVAPGQSGDPASPHFADQLQLYASWRYKPMRLDHSDLAGHVSSATSLGPSP